MAELLLGGWSPMDPGDAEASRIVGIVLDKLNTDPDTAGPPPHVLGSVLSAASQIVSGRNYKVTFTVDTGTRASSSTGTPTGTKPAARAEAAPQLINATVWEQPWLDRVEITELAVHRLPPDPGP